jgi:hypothetical protein
MQKTDPFFAVCVNQALTVANGVNNLGNKVFSNEIPD